MRQLENSKSEILINDINSTQNCSFCLPTDIKRRLIQILYFHERSKRKDTRTFTERRRGKKHPYHISQSITHESNCDTTALFVAFWIYMLGEKYNGSSEDKSLYPYEIEEENINIEKCEEKFGLPLYWIISDQNWDFMHSFIVVWKNKEWEYIWFDNDSRRDYDEGERYKIQEVSSLIESFTQRYNTWKRYSWGVTSLSRVTFHKIN